MPMLLQHLFLLQSEVSGVICLLKVLQFLYLHPTDPPQKCCESIYSNMLKYCKHILNEQYKSADTKKQNNSTFIVTAINFSNR